MKDVKSKVLQDLIKSMGERSVKDLKGKKLKVEDELEVEVESAEEPKGPPPLSLHVSGHKVGDMKKQLDELFE